MDLTTQKRLLTTLTGGFAAVAVAGVIWSLGSIDGKTDDQSSQVSRRSTGQETSSGRSPDNASADANAADFSLSMQRPLYDPPKPKPAPKPRSKPVVVRQPKQPRLDWTLVGTIIDSGRSVAILTDASGKTDIRGQGEEVELSPSGVLVRKIESDAVTLEIGGDKSTLRLKQSFAPGGGGGGKPDRPGRRRNR